MRCILLDIMMPSENGVETLAEIRKHEKFRREHDPGHAEDEPIKIIAVTALKHEEVLSLCEINNMKKKQQQANINDGGYCAFDMFDGYIEKPATLTKIRDAMEHASIMFASSLPSNNNNYNKNNNNYVQYRSGSNEGTNTHNNERGGNKGSNEINYENNGGTSSDEKGGQAIGTQSKQGGGGVQKVNIILNEGGGAKAAAKTKKKETTTRKHANNNNNNNNDNNNDNNNNINQEKDMKKRQTRPASSGETTSAAPDDLEKHGSNERNVSGKRVHLNGSGTEGGQNETTNDADMSNEDTATDKEMAGTTQNAEDGENNNDNILNINNKNHSRRSGRSKRNQSETRHSPSRGRDFTEEDDTGVEKDKDRSDSGEHQGSAGGCGKNSEDRSDRGVSPQTNSGGSGGSDGSGGSRKASGRSGNGGSGGSGAADDLNFQIPKGDAAGGDDLHKNTNNNNNKAVKESQQQHIQHQQQYHPHQHQQHIQHHQHIQHQQQQHIQHQQQQQQAIENGCVGNEQMTTTTADGHVRLKTQKEIEKEQNQAGRDDINNHRPCARCNSNETRFCYYNNGLLSQPRHYCRACQRYWTEGGTQRNLPKGSGRRKDRGMLHNDMDSNPAFVAAAGLAGLARNASHVGSPFLRPSNIGAAAVAATAMGAPRGQQMLFPGASTSNVGGSNLAFNFGGVSSAAVAVAAAARTGAGGGKKFTSTTGGGGGRQPTTDGVNATTDAAVLAGINSASNSDTHVAHLLSAVAGYDVNLAASLVGFAAARVGEEIARNAKIIHGNSPSSDITERVVTLAKITGWRIGTAISTIAMASVEHGMLSADVNALVQAQLPLVTQQATMEANTILQTMSSSSNGGGENNDSDGKRGSDGNGSGNSGGSGGTGVDSQLGNNINTQATSAPGAMQQAQQIAVARWMNDLSGVMQQQQQQQHQHIQQQQHQHMQHQQLNGDKSSPAAQYANLLMQLTNGDDKTKITRSNNNTYNNNNNNNEVKKNSNK